MSARSDSAGGFCFCVTLPVTCDQSPYPTCDGVCPIGNHCEKSPVTVPVLPTPDLPPEPDPPDCDAILSHYAGADVHALFPGGIDFSNPRHSCFRNVQRTVDPATGDETETFDSIVRGVVNDGSGPQTGHPDRSGDHRGERQGWCDDGSWDTEILSMSLSGDVGGISIEIRESPGLPSPGHTAVTDVGGGQFQIDSFFDVYTELSIDGGAFQPQTNRGRSRMDLQRVITPP